MNPVSKFNYDGIQTDPLTNQGDSLVFPGEINSEKPIFASAPHQRRSFIICSTYTQWLEKNPSVIYL